MKRERVLRIAVLLTMFAMMTSWLPVYDMNADLVENQERREQLGPGEPTIEERCSVLTFEDMFEYTKAVFNFTIASDWTLPRLKQLHGLMGLWRMM